MTVEQANLVTNHLKFARSLACRFFATSPDPAWDREECVACAYLGLVKAAQRWDPSRNVPFEAYARTRIWGEIMDALEVRVDWAHPAQMEITSDGEDILEFDAPAKGQSPEESAIAGEWVALIHTELEGLAPLARRVLLAWARGKSKAAIGREAGLPENRVYQIIASSLAVLRESPVLIRLAGLTPDSIKNAQLPLFATSSSAK